MTIKEHLEQHCTNNCLLPDQAKAVVQAQYDAEIDEMKARWQEDIAGYPPVLLALLRVDTNRHAVRWIDQHIPRHFARPLFTQE